METTKRDMFPRNSSPKLLPNPHHPHVVQLLIDSSIIRLCASRESLHYMYTRALLMGRFWDEIRRFKIPEADQRPLIRLPHGPQISGVFFLGRSSRWNHSLNRTISHEKKISIGDQKVANTAKRVISPATWLIFIEKNGQIPEIVF
ncbi:MAG: hypothetical protein ACR2OW_02560 [Methyloligellaceae bacterium]